MIDTSIQCSPELQRIALWHCGNFGNAPNFCRETHNVIRFGAAAGDEAIVYSRGR